MGQVDSSTAICTLALSIVKAEAVTDITQPEAQAEVLCEQWYEVSLEELLIDTFPPFSRTRATLPLSGVTAPSGFTDQYDLPNNFLALRFITDENIPLTQYAYAIEEGYIRMNNDGGTSIDIGYVKKGVEEGKFDAKFKLTLAHLIAKYVAFPLTGKVSIETKCENAFAKKKIELLSSYAKQQPMRVYTSSSLAGARRTYGGASSGYVKRNSRIF